MWYYVGVELYNTKRTRVLLIIKGVLQIVCENCGFEHNNRTCPRCGWCSGWQGKRVKVNSIRKYKIK